MLSPGLIGSSDLDLIQQLVLGWSKLVLAPRGLSSLNKLTRHDLIVVSGEVYVNRHSSVQFSHSVVSDSLQPHELQHARTPCPSPTPGVHSNSHPLSR